MNGTPPLIVVVSDATGETAQQASKAALAQFGHHDNRAVLVMSSIRSTPALEQAVIRARDLGALLVYTLVDNDLRGAVKDLAQTHGVTVHDLIGGLIRGLATHLGRAPLSVPGLGHELDEDYFRRIAAVEFAVNNDDGKNPQNLTKADIVIVGISRASKTPLSHYIANRGYRVSNVPIVMGVPLPRELDQVEPQRVFALTLDPVVLMKIRQARMESLRMEEGNDYGDIRQIRREINHAKLIVADHPGWTLVDMSRRAVEEAATMIVEAYRQRFDRDGQLRTAVPAKARAKQAAGKRGVAKKAGRTTGTKKKAAPKKKAAAKRSRPRGRGGRSA
ncbi:MAG: kinase/pyrophosphorylase [Planctomycetota bacterium]|nr:kinase/pyrophosphorylase [Planctomycetota bacterium]